MDAHIFDSIVINPDFLDSLNDDTYYYIEELVQNINVKYKDKLKSVIDGDKYRLEYETEQYNIKYEKEVELEKIKVANEKRDKRRKEKKKLRKEKEKKAAEKYEKKYKNRKNKMKVKGTAIHNDINIIKDVKDVMDDLVNKVVEFNEVKDNIQI